MHYYIIAIEKYFGVEKEFLVEAENKQHALEKAKSCIEASHEFDNYKKGTVRVVKKVQTKDLTKHPEFRW